MPRSRALDGRSRDAGPRPSIGRARRLALVVHRWVGLAIAAFVIVAGVTGSMMAFYPQVDAAVNPELLRPEPPEANAPFMDPFELRDRLERQLPEAKLTRDVILQRRARTAVNYWIDGREVFVDPYSGKLLGSRRFGDVREGKKSFVTFLYTLHFSLGLGEVGRIVFGVAAILWTIDCFVGAYLTFPPRKRRPAAAGRSWLGRWTTSWLVKTTKLFSLVFTWHRASGLWVWLMLLMFAWSAVALNLGEPVYRPVTRLVLGDDRTSDPTLPHLDPVRSTPAISIREARDIGRRLLAREAETRRFRIIEERSITYEPEHGAYLYNAETTLDVEERLAETYVYFDGDDGHELGFVAPTGIHRARTFTSWLTALHFGAVRAAGLAYRMFVCVMGLVVSLLSVTGVWIWWRKRRRVGERGAIRVVATSPFPGASTSRSDEE